MSERSIDTERSLDIGLDGMAKYRGANRYRVTMADGANLRIETNLDGMVTYAERDLRVYLGEWMPVVNDCLTEQHAQCKALAFGEVF